MQQVAVPSLSFPSSLAFFRPLSGLAGRAQTLLNVSARRKRPVKTFTIPTAQLSASRSSLSTGSGAANTGSRNDPPLINMVKKTKIVFGREGQNRDGDVAATATASGGGEPSTVKFGASFPDDYDVSEPQKVNETSLSEQTGADVLQRLKQGFVKFKEERFLKESDLFSQLAEGQKPKVMVIACADSRVCPTMLMGLNPGEVFTVRNVANLVPPCEDKGTFHGTSAALEFAVTGLKVEHIIVIGHRNCGGIKALMTRKSDEIESDFIGSWISCAIPARNHTLIQMEGRSLADQCKYCEQEAINVSLANLLTFPWIRDSFEAGKLGLHGWYYDFVEGELTSWEVQKPPVENSLEPVLVPA